ncbi:hypothetical protein PRZ48_007035 [Zasmidium cellare]|uniref:Uncharacterized protein n=1 Tax=Zasmidium cellare TaxID=395010 RepID=A0ABR0EJ55_ZASCE|nr:hypothetical protein PRZ48_007035 [Zasmidium cellare]
MPYNYSTAKDTLTDAEKARIICIFLNMDQSVVNQSVNWELAKNQIASASIESLKKGLQNTLKKLDKVEDGAVAASPTKKTPAKKTPSKKRKAAAGGSDADGAAENDADDDEKKKRSPKKKVKKEGSDEDDEV